MITKKGIFMNSCLCEKSYPDAEYLKSMYPPSILPIYRLVVNASDMMEYEGSLMFDEFPDKIRVKKVADKIAEQADKYDRNLIDVLVINEMLRRRIRRRNCRARGFC